MHKIFPCRSVTRPFIPSNFTHICPFSATYFPTSKAFAKGSKTYTFRADPKYASILSDAGVDVVTHANNHAVDFVGGIAHTRRAVTDHGMQYVGNGSAKIVEQGGVKVGFCAFDLSGRYSSVRIKTTLSKLKKKCDLVVVSFHWGQNYKYEASGKQRRIGQMAIRSGADLVLGHSSHVLSGVEKYRGKYIFYGLGTFSSAIKTPKDMDTVLASIKYEFDPTNMNIETTEVTLVPYRMSGDPKINDACPAILDGTDRARVLKKIRKYSKGFSTLPKRCFQ
ncbi:MAG: CapA family protein [Clostridia bacterium]